MTFANGDFKKVHDFETFDLNYPNAVPSGNGVFPPVGKPDGNCVPGFSEGWGIL